MNLPRIACFHGGGSNSAVFAEQCKRLRRVFANEYDFVFFDAPYEREAGPAVLPYFADYAPFRTWLQPGGDMMQEEEGLSRILQLMDADTLKRKREMQKLGRDDAPGAWIGAMGFSQGTRMVSGLLLRQQRTAYVDGGRSQRLMTYTPNVDLQFGVLCMGSSRPMGAGPTPLSSQIRDAESSGDFDWPMDDNIAIQIPTLHLHGLRDDILPKSQQQLNSYFDDKTAIRMEINYHHAMPWYTEDLVEFANMIRQTHQLATRRPKPRRVSLERHNVHKIVLTVRKKEHLHCILR